MAYNEDVNINLNILAGAMGGITAIMGGMSALTSTFGQFGTTAADSFGSIEGILVSGAALVTAFGVSAAEAAGEFEQSMKIVQAVSGQTGGAIQQLGEQANQLSVQYRMAIDDITEGLQTLGRAGLNSADAQLDVLESGLQTAKLEGRNLNSVLEELIQNTAMLGGNLDSIDFGAQTEYVNSLMVGTSMSAPINTHDISQTLQYVGGTAAAAGANLEDKEKLEDLMGTIAAFAQKGVTGSMAGTALRAFLTKPASQDKSVVTGLEAIGLSPEDLWEDGGESMKDISDQIELIQHQMDKLNLSTMDQLEIWGKIVGPKMGQQMMKLEADKIDELKGNIQEAASAEELATSTLNTYNQNINEMGQTASGIFRQLGSNIVMWLNPVVEVINKILSLLNHPAGGILLFGGFLAIFSHGIQAAYGMIRTLVSQIRSAILEVRTGIQALSGPINQSTSSAGMFKSEIDAIVSSVITLNANLMETDTLTAAAQAHLVGTKSASGYVRGFGPNNPLPENAVGPVNDKYTQYFSKPVMGSNYQAYKAPMAITADDYEKLRKSEKAKFDEVGRNIYAPKKRTISQDEYEKATPNIRRIYKPKEITQEEYDKLSKSQQKPYSKVGESYYMDYGHSHISTDEYHGLSAAEKKNYYAQDYRLIPRTGDYAQMKKEIEESTNSLRTFQGTTKQWKALSEEERQNHRLETARLRNDAQKELMDSKRLSHYDPSTGKHMYGYTTMHNIPKPETLPSLLSREASKNAEILTTAKNQQRLQEFQQSYKNNLGFGGRLRQGGIDKLDASAQRTSKALNRISTIGNQVTQKIGAPINNFSKNVQAAGGRVNYMKNAVNNVPAATGRFVTSIKNIPSSMRSAAGSIRAAATSFVSGTSMSTAALKLTEAEISNVMLSFGGLGVEVMSVEELLSVLAAELGISEKELVNLIGKSEILSLKFMELANATTGATASEVGQTFSKIAGGGGKLSGAFQGLVGVMGGPFSAALMGVTIAIQALQAAFQNYQQTLQKAETEMNEAKQEREEYENSIKELYSSENENYTESDLNRALLAQYGSIGRYDGGSLDQYGDPNVVGDVRFEIGKDEKTTDRIGDEKYLDEFSLQSEEHIKALNENTVQLAAATSAYAKSAQKMQDAISDPVYGFTGPATAFSDFSDLFTFLGGPGNKKSFFESGSPYLTSSQSHDSYAGSKELAPIIAADAKRFGAEGGLSMAFGTSLNDMREKLGGIESNTYKSMIGLAQNAANMTPEQAAAAQVSMKENKQDYQILGKLLAKREILSGQARQTSPLMQQNKLGLQGLQIKGQKQAELKDKKGNAKEQKTAEQQLRELKSIDNGINQEVAKLIRLSNGKLTEQNIIAMSQLQQFQDMYDIAQSTIAPGIMATVQQAYNNVIATQGAGSNAGSAAAGAGSAAANAAIIAQFLAQQAIDKAAEQAHKDDDSWLGFLPQNWWEKIVKNDGYGIIDVKDEQEKWGKSVYTAGDMLQHPGLRQDQYASRADAAWKDVQNQMKGIRGEGEGNYTTGFKAALGTLSSGIKDYAEGAALAAYMNSSVGEFGKDSNPSGSGGGGGGGDGGSGSDDDSGKNKKNRVDLVLCNKKEIPKLNVNLFKKEPNFTVLNKNFKLRDIKINTQDTPKSILSAVKNGIIDTAKRMDPKIIQDGESVYDPVGATEGTDIPSGSTPPTSN